MHPPSRRRTKGDRQSSETFCCFRNFVVSKRTSVWVWSSSRFGRCVARLRSDPERAMSLQVTRDRSDQDPAGRTARARPRRQRRVDRRHPVVLCRSPNSRHRRGRRCGLFDGRQRRAAVPAIIAAANPAHADAAKPATVQVASTLVVTAILAPLAGAWAARHFGDDDERDVGSTTDSTDMTSSAGARASGQI